MATATVLYVLKSSGDLAGKLPSIASGLDSVARAGASATRALGGGLTGAVSAARAGLASFGEAAHTAAEGSTKALAAMAALAYATHKVLSANEDWRESTARLGKELGKLQSEIADAFGPRLSTWLDNFTVGLAYIVRLIVGSVVPAVQALGTALANALDIGLGALPELFKALISGDISGAIDTLITTAGKQIVNVQDQLGAAIAGIQEANAKALEGARAAWVRQADGVRDSPLTAEEKQAAKDAASAAKDAAAKEKDRAAAAAAAAKLDSVLKEMTAGASTLGDAAKSLEGAMGGIKSGLQAGAVNSLHSTLSGGLGSVLAATGPVGAIAGAVLSLVNDLPNVLRSLIDEAVSLVVDLPGHIGEVFGEIIPDLLGRALPELIAAIVTLPVTLISALITSAPAIFEALINLFPELARQIGDQLASVFSSSTGDLLGTHLGKEAQVKSLFGIKLPFLDDGGVVQRSGVVYAHAGERYMGAPGSSAARTTNWGGVNVQVVAPDPRRFAEVLQRLQGSYGVGLSLVPFAGG